MHSSGHIQMLTSEISKLLTHINTNFLIYKVYRSPNNESFINKLKNMVLKKAKTTNAEYKYINW